MAVTGRAHTTGSRGFVVLVAVIAVMPSAVATRGPSTSMPSSQALDINAKVAQLDMDKATLDDVIRIFGEPRKYLWGNEEFTKDALPDTYVATYRDGFNVCMHAGKVSELRFGGGPADFRFAGKIGIGSTLEEALAVLGQPKKTVSGGELASEDGVLYKDCNLKGEKVSYYARSDKRVRLFLQDNKVAAIMLTCSEGAKQGAFTTVRPIGAVKEYDDVRFKDMSKLDLHLQPALPATLNFNQATVWPAASRMPPGCNPKRILAEAMNPGLGVRRLHERGITGKGVCVAIIDQPLYQDHPEFAGKIAAYHDVGCNSENSMHGPAVASLLVGTNCGTAPGATLYFAAAPSWTRDTAYQAKALDWIVEQNAKLPAGRKIRVVSVSAKPSGAAAPFTKNTGMWDEACRRAENAGMLVLDCTSHRGFIGACWYDPAAPEDVSKCTPGYPGMTWSPGPDQLLVPASPRTVAEEYVKGRCEFQYCGRGGLSWTIPYCAGVLAMGWQVRPDIPPDQMRELLFESALKKGDATFINPPAFIEMVKKTKAKAR